MNRVVFRGVLDGIVADRIVRDEEYSMPSMHFHPEFEIYYLFEGERYYFIEDTTYTVSKGHLVLIDAMSIHRTISVGKAPHDRFVIEITPEPFSAFFHSVCGLSLSRLFAERAGVWALDEEGQRTVERLLRRIINEFTAQKPHYSALVVMKLAELLLFVSRQKPGEGADAPRTPKHTRVNDIADYITNHCEEVKSLDELSKRFFLSKSYLCRIFKEITGSTVQEYTHMRRIQKAQGFLADSGLSVAEIAGSLGYGTLTHFERMFRKYTETTPLKYRQKMRLIRQKVRERKDEKDLTK
jgi:AraC-like DNA-binding protein